MDVMRTRALVERLELNPLPECGTVHDSGRLAGRAQPCWEAARRLYVSEISSVSCAS